MDGALLSNDSGEGLPILPTTETPLHIVCKQKTEGRSDGARSLVLWLTVTSVLSRYLIGTIESLPFKTNYELAVRTRLPEVDKMLATLRR